MQRAWCSIVIVCLLAHGSVARGDEARAVPPAAMNYDASADLMAKGARMKRAGTALITIAALLDGVVTGLAIGSQLACTRPGSCDGYTFGITAGAMLHTVALGVGIPLYAVGKSKLARGRRAMLGMALGPAGEAPGSSGASLQLRLRF